MTRKGRIMKTHLSLLLLLASACAVAQTPGSPTPYRYLSPVPGSSLISRTSNIIIRQGDYLDASTLSAPGLFRVRGSSSGEHELTVKLADDGKTILLSSSRPFDPSEEVTVTIGTGARTLGRTGLPPTSFSFTVTPLRQPINPLTLALEEEEPVLGRTPGAVLQGAASRLDTLPPDMPVVTIDSLTTPAPGYVFLTNAAVVPGIGNYMMMIDNTGYPVLYKDTPHHYNMNFHVLPNGLLYYGDIQENYWFGAGFATVHKVMDWTLTDIDSFECGNGYLADNHDFFLMPNGHALLFAYDAQPVDMSALVEGGNPGAIVAGAIVQELDTEKNVVFQWRSWDYIPITDSYMNLRASVFDYPHVNAIDLDHDGNILISSRHLCEVTKIDRQTGDIIWRLGGKQNQFTFLNENPANAPTYFTYQHSVRKLQNGNILMFDNGNLHPVQASRAVEYKLDEQAMTATMVWEYRHDPDIFAPSRGSVQRLPNGNTMIGWGSAPIGGYPQATEVTPDKEIVFEMSVPAGMNSFGVYRFVRADSLPGVSVRITDLAPGADFEFKQGDSIQTGVTIRFNSLSAGYNAVTVHRDPYAPEFPAFPVEPAPRLYSSRFTIEQTGISSFIAEVSFDSAAMGLVFEGENAVVYRRDFPGSGMFFPEPTVYDPVLGRWTATVTQFGEFALGVEDTPAGLFAPSAVHPSDGEIVNETLPVEIRWAPRGQASQFHLQVSTDSLLASPIVDDSTLGASAYEFVPAPGVETYYWRARALSDTGASAWTEVWSFLPKAPFLKITGPNGGEEWQRGASYFVTWEHNLESFVRLELLRAGTFDRLVIDSLRNSGGYSWRIPADVPEDSVYTIRILALDDTTISDVSDQPFAIKITVSDVTEEDGQPRTFALSQNYPNPFNPATEIRFAVPTAGQVRLAVYDLLGREVRLLVDEARNPGTYAVRFDARGLASGVYLYRLEAGSLTLVRKMVLLQ
jgi:hypothetical protein